MYVGVSEVSGGRVRSLPAGQGHQTALIFITLCLSVEDYNIMTSPSLRGLQLTWQPDYNLSNEGDILKVSSRLSFLFFLSKIE